jgi:hypothetical protein
MRVWPRREFGATGRDEKAKQASPKQSGSKLPHSRGGGFGVRKLACPLDCGSLLPGPRKWPNSSAGVPPAKQSGTYIEEIVSSGRTIPAGRF